MEMDGKEEQPEEQQNLPKSTMVLRTRKRGYSNNSMADTENKKLYPLYNQLLLKKRRERERKYRAKRIAAMSAEMLAQFRKTNALRAKVYRDRQIQTMRENGTLTAERERLRQRVKVYRERKYQTMLADGTLEAYREEKRLIARAYRESLSDEQRAEMRARINQRARQIRAEKKKKRAEEQNIQPEEQIQHGEHAAAQQSSGKKPQGKSDEDVFHMTLRERGEKRYEPETSSSEEEDEAEETDEDDSVHICKSCNKIIAPEEFTKKNS